MATQSGLKSVKGEMARDEKLRTADKQRQLEIHYEEKLKELLEEAGKVTAEGAEQINETRDSQVARLRDLVAHKTTIEQQVLGHATDIFEAYKTMELELETVLKAKIGDYDDARTTLERAAKDADDEEADKQIGARDIHSGARRGNDRAGPPSTNKQKQSSKKKVRKVPARANGQHAGDDRAIVDRDGIITCVLGEDQLRRAGATAKQGSRA